MTKPKSLLGITITNLAAIRKPSLILHAALAVLCLTGCNNCDNTVKSKVVSPDGRLIVRTCERNCGATTDFSSVVNLQSASAKYDSNDGVLFIAKGRYDISVKWMDSKSLLITCTGCSRPDIFREVGAIGDIDVSYLLNPK